MATILELAAKMEAALHDPAIWLGAIELTSQQLVQVNKQQLLDGRGNDGLDLPEYKRYLMQSGEEYATLKERLNPRNRGLWDMNYTGHSFQTMRGYFEGDQFRITSDGLMASYHRQGRARGRILGIDKASDHMIFYRQKYLYPMIRKLYRATVGL